MVGSIYESTFFVDHPVSFSRPKMGWSCFDIGKPVVRGVSRFALAAMTRWPHLHFYTRYLLLHQLGFQGHFPLIQFLPKLHHSITTFYHCTLLLV